MGVVYLAHNKLMGRDEVLKVMLRQIMERPGVLDRFLREIRAVASFATRTLSQPTRLFDSMRASLSPWSMSRAWTFPRL